MRIIKIALFFSSLFAVLIWGNVLNVPSEYATIQSAINAAIDGDTVLVAPQTYFENINFNGKNIVVASYFILNHDLNFISTTIIDGSNPVNPDTASCVLIINGETNAAVLEGFTLTGGTGTRWQDEHGQNDFFVEGGAILMQYSSPTIKHNIMIDNEAIKAPTGVRSAGGGAIRCGDSNPIIINNLFLNNSGMYGGAIVFNYCDGTVKNNIIVGNKVYQAVSGVQTFGGGGIWVLGDGDDIPVIENNIIYGNSSSGTGSGSAGKGGGISVLGTPIFARNNIVWANTQDIGGQLYVNAPPITFNYNDIEGGYTGTGNINLNPLLDTLNYFLGPTSPCIDTGEPNSIYNDPEDPSNLGFAEFPSLGTIRNDMGAYGGPSRTFLPDIPTEVGNDENLPPDGFLLYQNYPNPFNPNTKISYQIPESGFVSLKVYDVLGNEVASLVDEYKPSGAYEVEFSANDGFTSDGNAYILPSGVYFYTLSSGDFTSTKKLILLK